MCLRLAHRRPSQAIAGGRRKGGHPGERDLASADGSCGGRRARRGHARARRGVRPAGQPHRQPGTGGPAADAFITAFGAVPATAVGTLLAAHRPRNPIGRILLAIIIVEISPASQYLILDYRMHHGELPLGWVAVVLKECWPMFLVLISLLLRLFPDGTLPQGR